MSNSNQSSHEQSPLDKWSEYLKKKRETEIIIQNICYANIGIVLIIICLDLFSGLLSGVFSIYCWNCFNEGYDSDEPSDDFHVKDGLKSLGRGILYMLLTIFLGLMAIVAFLLFKYNF